MSDTPTRLWEQLGRSAPHPRVGEFLRRATGPWTVAVSGGADSVALLHLLLVWYPRCRDRLTVLHFDHGLRGQDSANDARFVATLAATLGLACVVGHPTEPLPADANEAALRRARLAFFYHEMNRLDAAVLCTGHQRDDIAESLLMALNRFGSWRALAAPRPVQAHPGGRSFVRPLLHLGREELRLALRAAGITWCDDASNASASYLRNRVRRELLPLIDALLPSFRSGAARARELAEKAEAWLPEAPDAPAPDAPEPSPPQWDPLVLPPGASLHLPGGATLRAQVVRLSPAQRNGILAGEVDTATEAWLAWNGEAILVRQWRPGDRYHPLGAPGSTKLQDAFVNKKVPPTERHRRPVVQLGDLIGWVPGLPPAQQLRLHQASERALRLTYRPSRR